MKQIKISKELSDVLLENIGQKMLNIFVTTIEDDKLFSGYWTERRIRRYARSAFEKDAGILHLAHVASGNDTSLRMIGYTTGYLISGLFQNGVSQRAFQTGANILRGKYSSILSPIISAERYEKLWGDFRDTPELTVLITVLITDMLKAEEFYYLPEPMKARIAVDTADLLIEEMFFLSGFSIAGDKKIKKFFMNLFEISLRCAPLWSAGKGIICISK